MTHKLDLAPFFVNGHRKLQSKWLAMSRNDLILLAGFDLCVDKTYSVMYRHNDTDVFIELYGTYIQPSINLEILVTTD